MIPTAKPRLFPPPGTRVRVVQHVRVGRSQWATQLVGTVHDEGVRPVGGMEMGAKAAFGQQPVLVLKGPDGELTTIAVDEQTEVVAI